MNRTGNRPAFAPTALAIAISLVTAHLQAADLPTGGNIVGGSGSISQDGNSLNVQQNSDKLITNWDSFDIGAGNTVNFYQPGSNSVALNRVIGEDASAIYGNLNANGKVFLVNPNGVLFGQGAAVNVGALVASTLSLSDEDFNNGNYQFQGDGNNAAVINRGSLKADNGTVALLGGQVSNQGIIQANQGNVALAAGDKVSLDFAGDGLLNVTVDEGTIDALVENHQLVRANGGQVVMTANATDALLQTVVNNTGIIEAQTLDNQSGTIVLKGGFNGGTVNVAGTLDASAPDSGDGGFIDTSGAHVKIAGGTQVTTKANNGTTGEWLIDPTDFYITDSNDPKTDSGIGAATLSANLEDNNITLATIEAGADAGDIHVDAAVSWNAATTLTLNAHNNIFVNAPITVNNTGGGLALNFGNVYTINAPIQFTAGSGGSLSVNGESYTLIHTIDQLQNIDPDVSGNFALANNIDAQETAQWNCSESFCSGFKPLGAGIQFSGNAFIFDGLGNYITNLTINRPSETNVGLFASINGINSTVRNLGLKDAYVSGDIQVGVLAGLLSVGASVDGSYVTGTVKGSNFVGGLVGASLASTITNSHSLVSVSGQEYVGGLVGSLEKDSSIYNSFAAGTVDGYFFVGGLSGISYGTISQSYATGKVHGIRQTGGLVGGNHFRIERSFATGDVRTVSYGLDYPGIQMGGLAGYNVGYISQSYSTSNVFGGNYVGGLVGDNFDGTINQSYAAGNVFYYGGFGVNKGQNHGGLVGGYSGPLEDPAMADITDSFFTFAADTEANTGRVYGTEISRTQIKQLSTFNSWGGDISAAGGENSVWRIYDGQTTPLLRSFLTPLTISAADTSRTYDGTTGTTEGSWSANNVYNSSQILGTASYTSDGKDAGAHALTISGLYSGQLGYDLIFDTGTLTINKAQATVTANSGTTTYNGTEQSVSDFTVDGLVNGEDESVVTGVTTSGGKGTNAGSYVLTVSGGSADNYELTFVDGTLTINKAKATVTANSGTTTYNGTEQSVSGFTVHGLVNGEDASVLSGVSTSGGKGTNAGSYTLTASGSDGNYELTFVDGTLTINKALATVTANSGTTTYNGTEQSGSGFTATGLVNGETESVLTGVTTSGGKGTNAGSYTLTASGTDGNYELTFVDGTLTINKAQATVTANSGTTTYNGTEQNVDGFTVDGLVNGEDQSVLTGVTTSGGGRNAGTYKLTASGSADNYELTFVDGTLTIERKAITGNISADGKTYDGSTYANTHGTLDDVISGDDLQFNTTGAFANKTAGDGKQVDVSGSLGGGDAGNYVLTTNSTTTANIDHKTITADVRALDKLFDGSLAATLEGVLNGTISGDDVALQLSGLFASLKPGENRVLVDAELIGADAGNYRLIAPSEVIARLQGFVQSADYQSAIDSQPQEQRELSAPSDTGYALKIDTDALRLSAAK